MSGKPANILLFIIIIALNIALLSLPSPSNYFLCLALIVLTSLGTHRIFKQNRLKLAWFWAVNILIQAIIDLVFILPYTLVV